MFLPDTLAVIGLAALTLGTIQEAEGPVERTFQLRNVGAHDVQLVRGYTSCGCTTIAFDRESLIRPGDTTSVTLRFNPRGKSGEFYETGTVTYHIVQPGDSTATCVPPQSVSPTASSHTTLTLEGICISSEESLMQQFPVRVADSLWLSADRFDLGLMHNGESRQRNVVLLHRDEADRREVVTLTITVDQSTPRGLQHLRQTIATTIGSRHISIPVTFDVIVR